MNVFIDRTELSKVKTGPAFILKCGGFGILYSGDLKTGSTKTLWVNGRYLVTARVSRHIVHASR